MKIKLIALSLTVVLTGCASTLVLTNNDNVNLVQTNKPVYTLVNLHPDFARGRLYSLNYQQSGLIPRCTQVNLISATSKLMKFQVKETGQNFNYFWHKRTPDFTQNIKKYFGTKCEKLSHFSKVDKRGIEQGKAIKGMSKKGVIQAMGYPPVFRTPRPMHAQTWIYWRNHWGKTSVRFNSHNHVVEVK